MNPVILCNILTCEDQLLFLFGMTVFLGMLVCVAIIALAWLKQKLLG